MNISLSLSSTVTILLQMQDAALSTPPAALCALADGLQARKDQTACVHQENMGLRETTGSITLLQFPHRL